MSRLSDAQGREVKLVTDDKNSIPVYPVDGNIPMVLVDTTRGIGDLLAANATYSSPVVDRPEQELPDGYMRVWVLADQSGTLYLEESYNNVNWATTSTMVVSAGVSNILVWTKLTRRYSRCRYVNGATQQGSFIMIHYTMGVGVTPTRIEDGDNLTLGAKNDTAVTLPTASGTLIALTKGLLKQLQGTGTSLTNLRKIGDYTAQQTAAALWTPASGKKFAITDIVASTATAGTITLLDDSTIIREYKLGVNGLVVESVNSPDVSATADNVLKVTTSGALDCFIVVKGYEV